MTLFSLGDCPVCADSGAVLVVRSLDSGRLCFFCPLCGIAWADPPPLGVLDHVHSLDDLAPSGISLPTRTDLGSLARNPSLREERYETWRAELERVSGRPLL